MEQDDVEQVDLEQDVDEDFQPLLSVVQNLTKYFRFDETHNETVCLVEGCSVKYTNFYCTTLRRHLSRDHPEMMIPTPKKRERRDVNANKLKFIRKCLVEIVAINGKPLSIANDSGMTKLMNAAFSSNNKAQEPVDYPYRKDKLSADVLLMYNNLKKNSHMR